MPETRVTLDDFVAWVNGGAADDRPLAEIGLAFAAAVGRVAGILTDWPGGDARRRDRLVDTLSDVAYQWARLSAHTGLAPSMLLARSRAHVDWRRAGRPAGGPAPVTLPMTLDEFTAWVRDTDGTRLDGDTLGDVGLALVGDAGEVVECLRRRAGGDAFPRERLAGELGDVWRYWTGLALAGGASPAELLERNRAGRTAGSHRRD